MAKALIPLIMAVLGAVPVTKAETALIPNSQPDMTYCEDTSVDTIQCFVTEGKPSEHTKYTFTPNGVTERLPAPQCDKAQDCEYLDNILYSTNSSKSLVSAIVTTERRIGDHFITRQDLSGGAYRLTDSRTGEEISLCLSNGPCSGTQYRRTENTITDKKSARFKEYQRRYHTIMGRFYGIQARR